MSSITINFPEERLLELQQLATRLDVSLEELARLSLEELLSQPEEDFDRAARYVLEKNTELYRRLG